MSTPALAGPQTAEITLSLFGGTDTELSPSDIPEGLSPDNQDLIFLPGDTSSRPCLHKLFNVPFPGGVSVVYEKSYVQPNGDPLTLILTSDGKLWVEDVANSPGVATQIPAIVPPGLYAQSISAFGREYIAVSDLLHGQGVPLQYDGTHLDRVTQDGPGAPPVVADEVVSVAIVAAPGGLDVVTASPTVASISETGFTVTVILTAASAYDTRVGDGITVAGVGAGYNGTFPVAAISPDKKTIQYLVSVSGLAPLGAAGTVTNGQIEVFTSAAANFTAGQAVKIAGAGVAGYNATYNVRTVVGPSSYRLPATAAQLGLAASGNGTISAIGNVAIGTHQVVQMFLTRNGYLTKPSPVSNWTATGGLRAVVGNLAIGPANVVARVLGFTGVGGDNFFSILANITLPNPTGPPIQIFATVIPDNTSTSAVVDFSDNALFAATPIDVIGNDLFDQVVLGPVLGFFAYGSRLTAWGDYNKIENFLNMGFCGGSFAGILTAPLGWDASLNSGGILFNGEVWAGGQCWRITGDGTANNKGQISQTAYLDTFGDAILQPNTQYAMRCWARVDAAGLAGNFVVTLSSVALGLTLTATVPLNSLSTSGGFIPLTNFNAVTPATIPSDFLLTIFENGMNAGAKLTIGELEIIPLENPFRDTLSRWSYVLNPEAFAQTTGNLGAADDDSPIRNFSLQLNVGELHTAEATHEFLDNGFEPGDGSAPWPVNALTHSVGCVSLRGCDPGKFGTGDASEDWDLIASKNGLYLHRGTEFFKVSQEMSRTLATAPTAVSWDDIEWAFEHTLWIKNDLNKRRAFIGAPVNGASAPNVIFVFDYRELDTASQIASAAPLHITLAGKIKSSDLARKWTRWNISANCGEILVRPGNDRDMFLGGGSGSTPGSGIAFGNIYSLDPAKLTDDDYGQIFPYYVTYGFVDRDTELERQLGSGRKLYKHMSAFVTGVGLVRITPLVNSLVNPLPSLSPRLLTTDTDLGTALPTDLEWITGVRGQRVFWKISIDPLPGTTDVQMKLQNLVVQMLKDPVAAFRSSEI